MKTSIFLLALFVLVTGSAFAQDVEDNKPPMDLPVYPGAEAAMEVNMTSEDILPMAQVALPMLAGKLGKAAEKLDPEEIASIFKDVKRIQVLQLNIDKPKLTDGEVAQYYSTNLPAGNWSRVFWQRDQKSGSVALYAQPGGEGLYGFRVRTVMEEGKAIKRVEVAKIEGKIDYTKLILIAGRVLIR